MTVTLSRLQRLQSYFSGGGTPTAQMQLHWQRHCENIETAFDELDAQLIAIVAAQATADSKNKTFRQTSAPTAEATGDLWIDTDDGNKAYRWSGSAWVEIQDIGAAYALVAINPDGTIANDKVVTASVAAGAVLTTPGTSVTSSTTLASAATWYDCGSVTATLSGVSTTVSVDFDTEITDNCKISYRLRNGSTTMGRERGPISVNTADEPGYSITRQHTPTAGSNTYTLQALCNDAGDATVHDPVFTITENKNL